MPIRAISSADTIKISDAVQAFQYVNYLKHVQGQDIVVTNNSWIEDSIAWSQSQALRDASAGVDQPGMSPILHVAAAGNDNTSNDVTPNFPASYDLDNIISVAATDWNDLYGDFSSYGANSQDLAAPGVTIATTDGNGRYAYTFAGTSAAAPFVAGGAALVWSAFPNLTAAQVRQRILGSEPRRLRPAGGPLRNGIAAGKSSRVGIRVVALLGAAHPSWPMSPVMRAHSVWRDIDDVTPQIV